jgi:hypothetical protein
MDQNDATTTTQGAPMTAKEAKARAKAAKAEAKALRPWYKKPLVLTAIGGAAIVGIAVAAGGGDDTDPATDVAVAVDAEQEGADAPADEQEGADAPAEEQDGAAVADVATVGDAVRDGNFEMVVDSVQTGVDSVGGEFGETAQGEFTIVTMTVTNIGDEPQTFMDDAQKGIDSQGREISADTTAGLYANDDGQGFYEEINPGNTITVNVVYDLPTGETLQTVELHDSAFSGGVAVSLTN